MNYTEFVEWCNNNLSFNKNYLKVKQILIDYYGEDKVSIKNEPLAPDFIFPYNSYKSLSNYNDTLFNSIMSDPTRLKRTIETSIITALIHFPFVKVTNEENLSTDIKDLYVKIRYNSDGSMVECFTMTRATYTTAELKAGYAHSHLPGIPHPFNSFLNPCLGTGPLRSRVTSLCLHYSDIDWELFCRELDQYTQVESIAGIPYRRLASITNKQFKELPKRTSFYSGSKKIFDCVPIMQALTSYLHKYPIKLKFYNNQIILGESYLNLLIKVSSYCIDYINRLNLSNTDKNKLIYYFRKYYIKNGMLGDVYNGYDTNDYSSQNDTFLFKFKGNDVKLKIIQINNSEENEPVAVQILNIDYFSTFITNLLKIANYYYGKQENSNKEETQLQEGNGNSNTSTRESSTRTENQINKKHKFF